MKDQKYTERILPIKKIGERIWKDILNFEGLYQGSNDGLVKSLERYVKCKYGVRLIKERILKPSQDKDGYLVVSLCKEGNVDQYFIHTLICTTFHGPCPEGMECRHLDNNTTNNHVDNLCWGTKKENQHDRIANGTDNRGEKSSTRKLTQVQVNEIRKLYATGKYTLKEVGDKFGVCLSNISLIVKYKHWKY
jgi:hypothetical protein